jgi:uncharacterized membrane protein
MVSLVCAGVFFVGIHVLVSGSSLRDRLVGRIGEAGFQGLFSTLSLVGIVWLCMAYGRAPSIALWGSVDAFRPLALVLMIVAALFVVIGLTTPSPTAAGGEGQLDAAEPATGILRVTRHPFLWGVALWATVHLILNGDAASLALFGALLTLALVGPRSIDAKRQARYGAKWDRFAAVTSNVPFGAILGGRNRVRIDELGWWRIALALALYVGMLAIHAPLFGDSPFPL